MKNDERRGWTSASNAEADSLCPGRHLAQRDIPEPETSPDAEQGNRIHAALAGDKVALTDEEESLVDKCTSIEKELLCSLGFHDYEVYREHRLWIFLETPLGFRVKHSGKADALFIQGSVGFIVDYKTGRNEVTSPASNMQLRDLAILASKNHKLTTVNVAIIQPWVTSKPEVCVYLMDDIVKAYEAFRLRIEDSNTINPPRIPGEKQCTYCKAKATCKEAREMALKPPVKNLPEFKTAESVATALDSETLSHFLCRATFAEKIITACRDEAKRRIEAGETVPGFMLKDGATREIITDPQECFTRCLNQGVKPPQFMGSVTIAKGKLKDALKDATGLKGKNLDLLLSIILSDITEEKQSSPSLVRISA